MAGMARKAQRSADLRIGNADREAAIATLTGALRDGRLDLAEYERRLVVVHAATTRADLDPVVADLPHESRRTGPALRISAAERDQAQVWVAEALTDGRLDATGYAEAEALVRRAVTHADLGAAVGGLDAKASLAERAVAVEKLDAAAESGLIEPAERAARVVAVQGATTDAQLTALVADLGDPAPGAPRQDLRRVSHTDREAVAARLQAALADGYLDLAEFDDRLRAAYGAKVRADLARLVDDLPESSPAASPAPRPEEPRGLIGRLFGRREPADPEPSDETPAFASLPHFDPVFGSLRPVAPDRPRPPDRTPQVRKQQARKNRVRRRQVRARLDPPARKRRGERFELAGSEADVTSLRCLVLPDGTPVAVAGSRDNTAKVWDLSDGSARHTLRGHINDVVDVATLVMLDGTPIAVTLSEDQTAKVWDLRDGSPLPVDWGGRTERPRAVACLTLPDGRPVAITAGLDGADMWDLRDGSPARRRLAYPDSNLSGLAVLTLPDGACVAVCVEWQNAQVRGIDTDRKEKRKKLTGHTSFISAVACGVLPDRTPVAVTASGDETAMVWDLNNGARRHHLTGQTSVLRAAAVVTLPEGTPIAVTAGNGVEARLWDLRDGTVIRDLDDRAGTMAALSLPDRTILVLANYLGVVVHTLS
jgi:WD40 repeat protein